MISINRIKTQETAFTPLVKFVSTASWATDDAIEPNNVSSPTATTTPTALPLITLLPIKAIFVKSVTETDFPEQTSAVFSTGSLSPVREA